MPFQQRGSWIFSRCFHYRIRKQKVHRRNLKNVEKVIEKTSFDIPTTEKKNLFYCV